jgi:hypothetical protein
MHMKGSNAETIRALLAHPLISGPEGVPAGATREECEAFEVATGLTLTSSLKDWYGLVNGGFCGTQSFYGLPTAVRGNHFRHNCEPNALAMGWLSVMADGCGSIYVVDLCCMGDGTPVYFCDHTDMRAVPESGNINWSKSYCVASDIWIFGELMLRQELANYDANSPLAITWEWPFDREQSLLLDPGLAAISDVRLPWQV